VARKEVDYLDILLLLRFISTFTIPSLILSQFLSLLDELLRLTVHGYYFASSPSTLSLILCFYFCLSFTRSHIRNRSLLSFLKLISLIHHISVTTKLPVENAREKRVQDSNLILA